MSLEKLSDLIGVVAISVMGFVIISLPGVMAA